jgi:hypothetical protein
MSLINDALKQARKAPPRNTPSALPPLQPAADAPVAAWLLAAMVILLIAAAIFFIGWAVAHHTVRITGNAPEPVAAQTIATQTAATQTVAQISHPAAAPPPANPPFVPKLQGIFYSPTNPSAIVNGKTVRPGDQFYEYHVKSISKFAVTFIGPDKKEIQIGLDH